MKRRLYHILTLALGLLTTALPLSAQGLGSTGLPATLIADRVTVEGRSGLMAEGNVEIFYGDARLTAESIRYVNGTEQLEIVGPLYLTEGGDTVMFADAAALSTDLQRGILQGARIVFEQQLQIAAVEVNRVNGRYTEMTKTVASSCVVCADHPVPFWQIRARRIVHDQDEQQLYFEGAQLRIADIPVFYLPYLRLPDPGLKRATGFLSPRLRTTNRLGFGLRVPYFIKIGDHRDLTLTPYFTSKGARALEARYRQAFRTGDIELNGAYARDDLFPGKSRGYLFGTGSFDLPRDFKLAFDFETVSDPAYLVDYGFPYKDRLDSQIALTRTRDDSFVGAELTYYETFRAGEVNDELPPYVGDILYEQRLRPAALPGRIDLRAEAHGHKRPLSTNVLGRDVGRISAAAAWGNSWQMQNGMIWSGTLGLRADSYAISDDTGFNSHETRASGGAAVELRWPLERQTARARHVLEPVLQLAYSDADNSVVPNEDSLLAELDEGNLFRLNRFPGVDRVEDGLRLNLGLTWTRYDRNGGKLAIGIGRSFRDGTSSQFTVGSGLDGQNSDWLVHTHWATANGLSLVNRALFDSEFSFTKNELKVNWTTDTFSIGSGFTWLEADIAEGRPVDTSEWQANASYQLSRHWTGSIDWRYNFVTDQPSQYGLGLTYRNECVTLDLSARRSFTSSGAVPQTTDFGLSVDFTGFGGGSDNSAYRRTCKRTTS